MDLHTNYFCNKFLETSTPSPTPFLSLSLQKMSRLFTQSILFSYIQLVTVITYLFSYPSNKTLFILYAFVPLETKWER